MSKEKLVPKLRFEGFENNEWIPYKLKNIVRFSKGRGYSKNDLLEQGSPIILYGRMYINYEIIIRDVDTYAKPKENTIYSEGTEVIVPSSGETAEDIARASFVSKKGIILGGDLNIMHLIENHNPFFLALSISNSDRKKELIRRAQGSSVVHLYNTDLENAVVYFPTLTEQNKISSFLEKIDKMIQVQQSKVNKVKDLKSAYLSEIFPEEGEKYPKKRFEGFTEPWIKKTVGEITNSYSGGTPSVGNSKYYTGNVPFIRSGEIHKEQTQLFINEISIQQSSAKMVTKGDILYALYGATSGEIAISKINGAINQAILALIPNSNCNAHFLAQYLNKEKNNILERYLQGGQGNLSGAIVIKLPETKEQQKIGEFFKNLDDQISIEEEKLAKLEQVKQAYLNDMFV